MPKIERFIVPPLHLMCQSRMLGILVDNAIEATNECNEKVVNIQFLKDRSKEENKVISITK